MRDGAAEKLAHDSLSPRRMCAGWSAPIAAGPRSSCAPAWRTSNSLVQAARARQPRRPCARWCAVGDSPHVWLDREARALMACRRTACAAPKPVPAAP